VKLKAEKRLHTVDERSDQVIQVHHGAPTFSEAVAMWKTREDFHAMARWELAESLTDGCTVARLHGCTVARLHGCTVARLQAARSQMEKAIQVPRGVCPFVPFALHPIHPIHPVHPVHVSPFFPCLPKVPDVRQ